MRHQFPYFETLQHYNTLQHAATRCNTLNLAAKWRLAPQPWTKARPLILLVDEFWIEMKWVLNWNKYAYPYSGNLGSPNCFTHVGNRDWDQNAVWNWGSRSYLIYQLLLPWPHWLCVYLCFCACVYIYVYISIYSCIHMFNIYVYTYMNIYVHIYINVYMYIYIYIYICIYIYIYIYMYMCMYMYMYICIYIYIWIYLCIRCCVYICK